MKHGIRSGTDIDTVITAAEAAELDAVMTVLRAAGLPLAGITDGFPHGYAVARHGPQLVAVAGLEQYGDVGLLRSVAVHSADRGRGLGARLVADRVRAAEDRGLRAVYLLTTTAADYFRRLGFGEATRDAVPAAVRASPEFTSICPASAVCLARARP